MLPLIFRDKPQERREKSWGTPKNILPISFCALHDVDVYVLPYFFRIIANSPVGLHEAPSSRIAEVPEIELLQLRRVTKVK